MKFDIPIVLAILAVGGLIVSALVGTFGGRVKGNCQKLFDDYNNRLIGLQLKQSASDEYRISIDRQLASIQGTLEKIWNKLL